MIVHCAQCDAPLEPDVRVEVWLPGLDDDEPPLFFCDSSCAGTFLTDMSLV
jgi:hypothetical protein